MELQWFWMFAATLLACYIFVSKVMRNLNGWYYDLIFKNKQYPLPPGDMGWPLIGNLWSFFKYFYSGRGEMFINNIIFKSLSFSLIFCFSSIFFFYNMHTCFTFHWNENNKYWKMNFTTFFKTHLGDISNIFINLENSVMN